MNKRGFTLIELLLVTALFPVVAMAAFSNFSAGADLWTSLNRQVPQENISLFYRKSRVDIDSLFKYLPFPVEADEKSVSFMTSIRTVPELGGEFGIGRVTYVYDENSRRLVRVERNMSEVHGDSGGRETVMLEGVEGFSLSYYTFDKLGNLWEWKSSWNDAKTLPAAIRFEFSYGEAPWRKVYRRTLVVPAGTL
jgi:prepilin-type N-terminal cleavage/methylation domain-containing protein